MNTLSERQLKNQDEWERIILDVDQRLFFAHSAALLKWRKTDAILQCSQRLLRRPVADIYKHDLWETYKIIRKNIIYGGLKYLIIKDLGNGKSFYRCHLTRPVKSEKEIARVDEELMNLAEKIAIIAKISA